MHSILKNLKKREGFTLIELMIVVAIIGILAAIAIPNFIKFQLRSKASEGKINLAAIRTAQESFFAEVGTYFSWSATPSSAPGQVKAAFASACSIPPSSSAPGFCFIGWEPEGDVFYQYAVNTNTSGNQFFADAQSDIDGDGNVNIWGISRPDLSNNFSVSAALGCSSVLNVADSSTINGQVGPCNNVSMGRQIF